MPETFREWSDEANDWTESLYFTLAEVAAMFHMSRSTAYDRLAADQWPHMLVANRVWLSTADVEHVRQGMRRNDPPRPPEDDDGPRLLGQPIPADPWLDDDGEPDQDPGGVR